MSRSVFTNPTLKIARHKSDFDLDFNNKGQKVLANDLYSFKRFKSQSELEESI